MNKFVPLARKRSDYRAGKPSLQVVRDLKRSPLPTVVLIAADLLAVELALALAYITRNALVFWWPISIGIGHILALADGLVILPVAYYCAGLQPGYGLSPVQRLRTRALATIVVFGILISWDRLIGRGDWSRGVLALTFLFTLMLVPVLESLARGLLIRFHLWGRPVAIFGANTTGLEIARMLRTNPLLGLVPIGFFDDRARHREVGGEPAEVLGGAADAKQVLPYVDRIIIAIPNAKAKRLNEIISRVPFADVTIIPNLLGFQTLWITTQDLNGVLGLSLKRNLLLRHNRVIKRMIDLTVGTIAFAIALPIIGIFALLIWVVDPGPAFCSQVRIGEHGRSFKMLKLRSMRADAEQWLAQYLERNQKARDEWERFMKLRNDPRILPFIGKFMRALSIDELPQLWHVIKGEMSLVGPRPFPQYHIDRFSPEFRKLRASVRPGLTGLWQVSSRSEGDLTVQELQDTYFIRNWSPWLDLYVLSHTVQAVLGMKGAR
jgi:Undecaprenyl-phosphate galactose phosphotransferase WbaP